MPNQKITVKDIARICGVSIGTVDRAINNRGGINPETKKAILEAADRYGFVKNQLALTLSSGKSSLIGVIIFDLGTEFATTLLTAIEKEAGKRGYATIIMMSNYNQENEIDCVRRMRSMNVAGLIVFSVLNNPDCYRGLIQAGVPVVAVGNRIAGTEAGEVPFVGIDDYSAMKTGTEFVISRGYKKLVYVAPLLEKASLQNIYAQSERFRGFLDAADGTDYELIDTYAAYEERLPKLSSDSKTALICPSDAYTIKCLSLHGNKYGILGFDRLSMIGALIPKLSGIVYPADKIGGDAVSVLLDGGNDVILPFELIQGETI